MRCERTNNGFTLIEVVASLVLLSLMLTSLMTAYHRTVDSVVVQSMRERSAAVAQRQMELLLASLQEPNSIGLPRPDEVDTYFNWQLDLKRITIGTESPKNDFSNTVIKATVKARPAEGDKENRAMVELVRYLAMLKPIPGHAVAVPFTREYEEPPWYQQMREKLGREPSLDEILKHMFDMGELPADMKEEMDLLEDMDELEDLDDDDLKDEIF